MAAIYTATVDGKSYGFDFDDQRIDIDATINTLLVTNLWIAIKEAMASLVGITFDRIATGGGTDVLGTGVETFLTVTLLDNWEVNTLKVSGKFEVQGGNLIRDDQSDPFRDNASITYISFLSQAGIATLIETGVSGLTPTESAQLADISAVKTKTDALPGSVWDEPASSHVIAGSMGAKLNRTVRLTKNTAFNNFAFQMFNATTHLPMAGLTITSVKSIDGGAFSSTANSAVEISSGWYKLNLAAGDLNGDSIILRFTSVGADETSVFVITQEV